MAEHSEPVVLGLWYEDFEIGEEMLSPGRTITEADLVNFAGVTGDYSQVHTDTEYCRGTIYGQRIAHGLFGLSVAQGLMARKNYTQGTGSGSLGWNDWRFRKPIFIGDTIRVRWHFTDKRESASRPGLGIVVERVEIINQNGEVVQDGEHVLMVRRRPDES